MDFYFYSSSSNDNEQQQNSLMDIRNQLKTYEEKFFSVEEIGNFVFFFWMFDHHLLPSPSSLFNILNCNEQIFSFFTLKDEILKRILYFKEEEEQSEEEEEEERIKQKYQMCLDLLEIKGCLSPLLEIEIYLVNEMYFEAFQFYRKIKKEQQQQEDEDQICDVLNYRILDFLMIHKQHLFDYFKFDLTEEEERFLIRFLINYQKHPILKETKFDCLCQYFISKGKYKECMKVLEEKIDDPQVKKLFKGSLQNILPLNWELMEQEKRKQQQEQEGRGMNDDEDEEDEEEEEAIRHYDGGRSGFANYNNRKRKRNEQMGQGKRRRKMVQEVVEEENDDDSDDSDSDSDSSVILIE